MFALDSFTAPLGPVDLSVAEAGRGGVPLLLVHGFCGTKEDFGDWLDRFAADGWWVVAPDLRGHGASAKPADRAAYSLDQFAADLVALVDQLGWDRYALLGHSMGGMIAEELALTDPARLSALILMDTDHGPVAGISADDAALGAGIIEEKGLDVLLDFLASLPPQRAASEERLRATRPGFAEWSDAKAHGVAPAMYAAMALALTTRPDRLPALAGLTVPTRVVVGAEDVDFLPAGRRLAATIPGADLVVIDDAKHSPQFEHPEAWWDAVAPFLAAHRPG